MHRLFASIVVIVCAAAIAPARQAAADANAKALAQVKARLAGHESDMAETYFTNISILKGRPASRLPGMMEALTGLIGVDCTHCHVEGDFASDDKPAKRTARRHFAMIKQLNQDEFGGENKVSCWTCHHGKPKPELTAPGSGR